MVGKRRWASLLLIASLATAGLGLSAGADAGTEDQFLSLINSTRAANGLGALVVDGNLRAHARDHTQAMIAANDIFHSTSAELQAAAGSGWSKLAENVGRGGSPDNLHTAFMDSPGHRQNILGDFNYVGIGTGSSDGRLYVTVVFMKKGATPEPTTTTQPAPTTTTPTTDPTDTTTTAPAVASPTTVADTTTTTAPTTMVVGPDHEVTPGEWCIEATRFSQMCQD